MVAFSQYQDMKYFVCNGKVCLQTKNQHLYVSFVAIFSLKVVSVLSIFEKNQIVMKGSHKDKVRILVNRVPLILVFINIYMAHSRLRTVAHFLSIHFFTILLDVMIYHFHLRHSITFKNSTSSYTLLEPQ